MNFENLPCDLKYLIFSFNRKEAVEKEKKKYNKVVEEINIINKNFSIIRPHEDLLIGKSGEEIAEDQEGAIFDTEFLDLFSDLGYKNDTKFYNAYDVLFLYFLKNINNIELNKYIENKFN